MGDSFEALADVYRDLHAHPELGFNEHRTAGIVADQLRASGYEVTEGVGGTGVVGVLERGEGPTVMLRADMDGLPVMEETGLPYASTDTATLNGSEVGLMHACGHDMHTTSLIGAAAALAADTAWQGRLVLVFQPAEEGGRGARAMVEDGLIDRFGRPVVVLGQHVSPLVAGAIGMRSGVSFAASDAVRITVHGKGGHGSRPETTVDPVVLASSIVLRLQTIVSREIPATAQAVVTVGMFNSGDAPNIIPSKAVLGLSIRTFDTELLERIYELIRRIVDGEAAAAGADQMPEIEVINAFPAVNNDAEAIEQLRASFVAEMPDITLVDPGVITGSEDVWLLAEAADAPCAFWILGGADPVLFADAKSVEDVARIVAEIPSNHSPFYAPVIDPTLKIGVKALHTAARSWLA